MDKNIELAKKLLESKGYKVTKLNESNALSLEDIQNVQGSGSMMDDNRPTITVDNRTYIKIGKNKWEYQSMQSRVLGGIISDQQMYDKVVQGKDVSYSDLSVNESTLRPDEFLSRDAKEYLKNPNVSAQWSAAYTQEVKDYIEEVGKDSLVENATEKTYYINFKAPSGTFEGKYIDKPYRASSEEEALEMFKREFPQVKRQDYKVIPHPSELSESTENDKTLESILKDAGLTNIRRTRTGFAGTKPDDFYPQDIYGFEKYVGETLDGQPVYLIRHQGVNWYVRVGTPNNVKTVTINTNCPKVIYY